LNDPEKVAPWLYRLRFAIVAVSPEAGPAAEDGRPLMFQRLPPARPTTASPTAPAAPGRGTTKAGSLAMSRLPRRDAEILMLKYNED